jgi:multidrug efflux system membrane fusion protein
MTTTALEGANTPTLAPRSAKKRRWWLWLLGLAILAILGYRYVAAKKAAAAAASRGGPKPTPVVVVPARTGDIPVYLRGLGTVTPFKTATVRSRVDGQLMSVAFREGQDVHEGDLLAQIDPRPFNVQLEQAQGQLAKDQAALHDAQINLDRFKTLFDQQILPQQQLDSQKAVVEQLSGALKSDEAQIESAKLQLTYSRITAPFTGRVGLRLVDPGNIVHANDTNGLLVLTQLHPITVIFSLPQDDLGEVFARIHRAGPPMPAEAWDRDNTKKIADGTLASVDNEIDPTTGTYKLKAAFENARDELFPNQFVNVRLLVDTRRGLLVVPAAALLRGPQGAFVYVVSGDKAAVKTVSVALTEGQDMGLSAGLQPGDQVVVDGQDKLQEGTLVDVGTRRGGGAPAGSPSSAPPKPR